MGRERGKEREGDGGWERGGGEGEMENRERGKDGEGEGVREGGRGG